jgi:predicted RecA/RadA family phage recombinase
MEAIALSTEDTIIDVSVGSLGNGQVIVLYGGRIVGVVTSQGANKPLVVKTRGRYLVLKDTTSITKGSTVYWDNTNRKATATNTGIILGLALAAAATTDTQVEVYLNA